MRSPATPAHDDAGGSSASGAPESLGGTKRIAIATGTMLVRPARYRAKGLHDASDD